jgi:hypothetical protein
MNSGLLTYPVKATVRPAEFCNGLHCICAGRGTVYRHVGGCAAELA